MFKNAPGRPSVTSFSSCTIKSRKLKFGMHNPYIDGSKVTDQFFPILPGSWDICSKIPQF